MTIFCLKTEKSTLTEYSIGSSAKFDTNDRLELVIRRLERCGIRRPVLICRCNLTGAEIRRKMTESEGFDRAYNSISPRFPSDLIYI